MEWRVGRQDSTGARLEVRSPLVPPVQVLAIGAAVGLVAARSQLWSEAHGEVYWWVFFGIVCILAWISFLLNLEFVVRGPSLVLRRRMFCLQVSNIVQLECIERIEVREYSYRVVVRMEGGRWITVANNYARVVDQGMELNYVDPDPRQRDFARLRRLKAMLEHLVEEQKCHRPKRSLEENAPRHSQHTPTSSSGTSRVAAEVRGWRWGFAGVRLGR
jgi:hypothetical protein